MGHVEDETGLVYMRARYYEPSTGRFLSEDPARDGGNWYLYADGNAVNRVDFTGKRSLDAITQVAILGLLMGFFLSLGMYVGEDMASQRKTLGSDKFRDAVRNAFIGAACSWFVAWIMMTMYGTEGLGARIPLRVGYISGGSAVAGGAYLAGFSVGILHVLYMRAGQALFEIFLIDWESGR